MSGGVLILFNDERTEASLLRQTRYSGSEWSSEDGVSRRLIRTAADAELPVFAAPWDEDAATRIRSTGAALTVVAGRCTGRWAATKIGDVICALRVFSFDAADIQADPEAAAKGSGKVQDPGRWRLPREVKRAIDGVDWEEESKKGYDLGEGSSDDEPPSDEQQMRWMAVAMHRFEAARGPNPINHPERGLHCPDWTRLLAVLRERGLIMPRRLALTDAGHKQAEEWGGRIEVRQVSNTAYRVNAGPVGSSTGSAEIGDPELFVRLNKTSTKILCLDTGLFAQAAELASGPAAEVVPVVMFSAVEAIAGQNQHPRMITDACDAMAVFLHDLLHRFGDLSEPE